MNAPEDITAFSVALTVTQLPRKTGLVMGRRHVEWLLQVQTVVKAGAVHPKAALAYLALPVQQDVHIISKCLVSVHAHCQRLLHAAARGPSKGRPPLHAMHMSPLLQTCDQQCAWWVQDAAQLTQPQQERLLEAHAALQTKLAHLARAQGLQSADQHALQQAASSQAESLVDITQACIPNLSAVHYSCVSAEQTI